MTVPKFVKITAPLLLFAVFFFVFRSFSFYALESNDYMLLSEKQIELMKGWFLPTGYGIRNYADVYLAVYSPLGYKLCRNITYNNLTFWPYLVKEWNCNVLFKKEIDSNDSKHLNTQKWKFAPKYIPANMMKEYLLENFTRLSSWYINEPNLAQTTRIWSTYKIDVFRKLVRDHVMFGYRAETELLYQAVAKYSLKDANVLVIGSIEPWVEATALENGAGSILTVDYTQISIDYPNMQYINVNELANRWIDFHETFDVGISFSSIEHSGLGRYGDPLCPGCDLVEMAKISCLIKPNGLLFLTIPLGQDELVFNAHRIYGRVRLPLLTANWLLMDLFLLKEAATSVNQLLDSRKAIKQFHSQGLLVLRKQSTKLCSSTL